jgi:hypothetical protein
VRESQRAALEGQQNAKKWNNNFEIQIIRKFDLGKVCISAIPVKILNDRLTKICSIYVRKQNKNNRIYNLALSKTSKVLEVKSSEWKQ